MENINFQIEISKDNYEVAKIRNENKWIYIGSKYNMEREIELFLQKAEEGSAKEVFVIFGFGAGEHIKRLRNKFKEAKIIIYEPNYDIKKYFEETKWVKNDKEITIYDCSNDSLKVIGESEFINEFNLNKIDVIPFCNYDKIYAREYVNLLNKLKDIFINRVINKNTKFLFSERWFKTTINNLPYMTKSVLIDRCKEDYKNKPAIIVSAGPSLDKNIDLLIGKEENFFIITGGRPLKGILEKKINPGLLVALDPGEINYNLVKGSIETTNIPLLFFDTTNEKIVENHRGYKLFSTYNEFIYTKLLEEKADILETYGSVAHSMVSAAVALGCNPIIFIGQDFAYTNEKAHSAYLEEKHNEKNVKVENGLDIWVEDVYGGKVRTSRVLNEYRIGMEQIIEKNSDIVFINATEGGARMKGTVEMTLHEVIDKYGNTQIGEMKRRLPDTSFKTKTEKELKNMINVLRKIREKCNKANNYLKVLEREHNINKTNEINFQLGKIDNYIKKEIMEFSIIESLLYPIMYDILTDDTIDITKDKNEKKQTIIKQSKKLYTALLEVIDRSISEIKTAVIKIEGKGE